MGELSSPVSYQLATTLKRNPAEIAKEIAQNTDTTETPMIKGVEAVSGYINFRADIQRLAELVLETAIREDREYGFLKAEAPERAMVEHTSANPIGPIHIGNARNSILGACLAEMLKRRGHDTVIHFLVNDMGRQVAMATYGWRLLGMPEPQGQAELWVGTIYATVNVVTQLNNLREELQEAEARGRVMETAELQEEIQEYETAREQLRERHPGVYDTLEEEIPDDPTPEIVALNTAYENNDPETVKDVRRLIGYCLQGFEKSLGDIGITFDSFDYESDLVWRRAAEEVLEDLRETPYVYEDQGATILDCDRIAEDHGLKERWDLNPDHEIPRLVLVRSDGTTLYTLRDMAYSIWKFSFVDTVINVIGYEQTLAQLQLRIALAALDKTQMGDNQLHYAYEFVKLPGIKMSGRLGRYVTLNEVIDRATHLALKEVTQRSPHLPQEDREEIARMVGYGAVKHTLLSVDPMKAVVFDWERALDFETNSAPYIQYSHARACNILKRTTERPDPDYSTLVERRERELLMTLASFPEAFEAAATELKPGELATYANALADTFNSFYAVHHVLQAETPGLSGARLRLVEATRITLRNAMETLGIVPPERM
jgi:arginyl-tRNA synthetase